MRLPGRAPVFAGRASIFAALLFACIAAGPAAAGRASLSPSQLYSALLKGKVTTAQLPNGYKGPVVGPYTVSAAAKKHHALGGIEIVADEGNEAIIYIVFATAKDARLDWENANFQHTTTSPAPSSIAKPSVVVSTSASEKSGSKTIVFGLTDVGALRGNVIVQAATSSTTSKTHGNVAGAIALERFALAHLASLQ